FSPCCVPAIVLISFSLYNGWYFIHLKCTFGIRIILPASKEHLGFRLGMQENREQTADFDRFIHRFPELMEREK
ncbi:MAG: hypothetical protein RR865_10260, partial [Clostridia bacterium]